MLRFGLLVETRMADFFLASLSYNLQVWCEGWNNSVLPMPCWDSAHTVVNLTFGSLDFNQDLSLKTIPYLNELQYVIKVVDFINWIFGKYP